MPPLWTAAIAAPGSWSGPEGSAAGVCATEREVNVRDLKAAVRGPYEGTGADADLEAAIERYGRPLSGVRTPGPTGW